MKRRLLLWLLCAALVITLPSATPNCRAASARASGGMVATVHPAATDAGVRALRQGGNAIDAAVAAALTLGVVDSHNSGLGGGCFMIIRLADGTIAALDGREIAPARATRDMYLRDGKPQPSLSQTGPLASGVPGALAAHDYALRHFGRLKLRDLLLPAAEIAEKGFIINKAQAGSFRRFGKAESTSPGLKAVLLKADGSAYQSGERFKQPDLARTYRAIAEQGPDWFYKGPFARTVGKWMADNGGIITADDFAGYSARRRAPVVSTYRRYTVVGFPPPSSGGVHVAQILNILEHFDLGMLYRTDRARAYHIIAEAMKLAFADRVYWLGDPGFAKVPRGLIDKKYAAELAARIDPDKVTPVTGHSQPPRAGTDLFGRRHTTHIAAVDGRGNWVGITATINTGFGSKVVVPGTGLVLNNEMDDFSIAPGVPNSAGLLGAEANAVEPGKRPLSSMSPTIVLDDGRPIMTVGAAGGPTIITQVVMAIVGRLDFGLDLTAALAGPRIHHQWRPDQLKAQTSLGPEIIDSLKQRGHDVLSVKGIGITQAIALSADGKCFVGVHDPRVPGKAAGP